MANSSSAAPITYSLRERLLINLSLATFLLILAQLPWPLAELSFIVGGVIFLVTVWWAVVKMPLPQVSISINISRPKVPEFPKPAVDWKIRAEIMALDEVRFSLLLLAASLLLGLFYTLSFIRFLNAHNGLSMFFVWQGIK